MTETYRVLASDKLAQAGLAPLEAAENIIVDVQTGLSPAELQQIIPDYDALLVRSATTADSALIEAGKRLQVIARAGVGVDNIDLDAATQAGIIVVNAPTGNTVAAAEHTTAMLMALARNIPQAHAHVQGGQWKRNQFVGTEVRDKILGSVGMGRVAQEVCRHAQGLGMKVMAYDPYVSADYAAQRGITLVDLDTLIASADFITLHTPLTPETRNLIDQRRLQQMKPGTRILNVSRGGIIDEAALVEAIHSGHIAGAALDVFDSEPLDGDSPLRDCEQIILTPHLGASTVEAQEQVAKDVALQVIDVLNGGPARYAVNAPILPPKDLEFMAPYIDLAERMGRFLKQLEVQGISDIEITAHGKLADYELAYVKAAIIRGLLADVVQVRVNLVNATLVAEERGIKLVERKEHQSEHRYENMLTLQAKSGQKEWSIRGTVLRGEPQIVGIDDLWVDFPAQGRILISGHLDRPGIIGKVGTILGGSDVNISFMQMGRSGPRTDAIMALGLDESPPVETLAEIKAIKDIYWLSVVNL